MILNDYHLHSSFSGDCDSDIETIILHAITSGMKNICFTDHHDYDFPYKQIYFELDIPKYINILQYFKEKYKDKINVRLGIELGIQKHLYNNYENLLTSYPFDFVLCSNHLTNGLDPYYPQFFENKSKEDAYNEYFSDILSHTKNYNGYDSYGHLDYVIRYGPYEDKTYLYSTHEDILDEVLKTIIEKGKGIELNTSGFIRFKTNPHPRIEVIKRYKELGGEIITVGSDSHKPENLLYRFDLAEEILKNAGFKYYTIFVNREAQFIKL